MVETLNYLRGPKNRPQSTVLLLLMIHTISYLSIHCWFLLTWTNGGRAAGLIVSETTINLEWKEKARVVGQSILPRRVSVPFFLFGIHISLPPAPPLSPLPGSGGSTAFSLCLFWIVLALVCAQASAFAERWNGSLYALISCPF